MQQGNIAIIVPHIKDSMLYQKTEIMCFKPIKMVGK